MDNNPVLERFKQEYHVYHGITEKRSRETLKELRGLASFAGKDGVEDCDANDVRAYLAHLVEEDLHVNTVRKRHGMLSPFFTWGFQAGLVSAEQLMAIKLVENPKGATGQSEPKPYSPKELAAFWADLDARLPLDERFDFWFDRFERGLSKYRRIGDMVMRRQVEAIVSLALEGGLRRIELFSAEIDHIHPDNAMLIVPQRSERGNGKDRYREVPFTNPMRNSLHRWLQLRAKLGVQHDRPWIIGWKNQPFSTVIRQPYLTGFSEIPSSIGPYEYHRFRHTCATLWLRSGMKLELVQRLMGHSTLQQTLAYAKIVHEDIEASVETNEKKFLQLTRRDREYAGT